MRGRNGTRKVERPGAAWRDGGLLVFYPDAPLPPICVFCGAPAVFAMRGLIEFRADRLISVDVRKVWIPLCRDDRTSIGHAQFNAWVAFMISGLILLATWVRTRQLPPVSVLLYIQEHGYRNFALLTAAGCLVGELARRLHRAYFGAPPPAKRLRYASARDGYVWLSGVDPRCLAQLPPVPNH